MDSTGFGLNISKNYNVKHAFFSDRKFQTGLLKLDKVISNGGPGVSS